MKNDRGFTFVEILVAAGVLATVLAAVYSVFWTGMKAGSRKNSEMNMSARQTLDLLSRDLRSVCFKPDIEAFRLTGEYTKSGGARLDRISFCTIRSRFDEKKNAYSPEPIRVEYFLSAHPVTGEIALYRTERRMFGSESGYDQSAEEKEPVAPYIKELQLEYESNGEWTDSWDKTDSLPERVRITVGMGESGKTGGTKLWTETALPTVRREAI